MAAEEEAVIAVTVVPRSSRDAVGAMENGVVRVRVTRPPADGEANRAVLRLLADALDLPPSALALLAGARSRHKRIRVSGLALPEVGERLARRRP